MREDVEQSEQGQELQKRLVVFYSEDSENPEDLKWRASSSFYGIQESGKKERDLYHEH